MRLKAKGASLRQIAETFRDRVRNRQNPNPTGELKSPPSNPPATLPIQSR